MRVQLPLPRATRTQRQLAQHERRPLVSRAAAPRRVAARGLLPVHPGAVQLGLRKDGLGQLPAAGAAGAGEHAADGRAAAGERRHACAAAGVGAGARAVDRARDVCARGAADAPPRRRAGDVDGGRGPHCRDVWGVLGGSCCICVYTFTRSDAGVARGGKACALQPWASR